MNENRCVICGTIIPEGRQVCPDCENKRKKKQKASQLNKETVRKTINEAITVIENYHQKYMIDDRIREALYEARDYLMQK